MQNLGENINSVYLWKIHKIFTRVSSNWRLTSSRSKTWLKSGGFKIYSVCYKLQNVQQRVKDNALCKNCLE